MLPRRHRLTSPEDYRAVLRGRRVGAAQPQRRRGRAGTDLLVVHLVTPDQEESSGPAPSPEASACPRVGFVVSRAVGNSVVRHRVVRRLRAQVAQRLETLPSGSDVVVRALPPAAQATSHQLGEALDRAFDRTLRSHG